MHVVEPGKKMLKNKTIIWVCLFFSSDADVLKENFIYYFIIKVVY